MATELPQLPGAEDAAWHDLENSIAEIARLAKSDVLPQQLSDELLKRTVRMLSAVGGAVWLADTQGDLRLEAQINLESLDGSSDHSSQVFHRNLLQEVLSRGETQVVPPKTRDAEPGSRSNPSDYLLILCPLRIDEDVAGVVEVIQRPTTSAADLAGNRRLVSIVSELAADYLKRRAIKELRQRHFQSRLFQEFTHQVHASLDLREAAYRLVNEGRRYIGCDRVSLAIRSGQKFRLLATSGVDSVHRRSNMIRSLEDVASKVAGTDEPLWYRGDSSAVPPQIEESIRSYVDQAHAKTVAVIPLQVPPANDGSGGAKVAGVLIAEQFAADFDDNMQRLLASVASQGALAIKNALEFQSLPTLPFARSRWRAGSAQFDRRRTAILTLLVGIFVAAVLVLVPAEFYVEAHGTLQPRERREVFAPVDGEIIELKVAHGDDVAAGDVLLVLRNPELDLELQRVQGEFATTQQRLLAAEAALLQANPADVHADARQGQLAAKHLEVKQQIETQQKQLELLRQQRDKLQVRSPIAGRVLTWDLDQLLEDRPVQRGQALMTVANTAGPWDAELEVPDDRIGFVLEAQHQGAAPRSISFELATSRGVVHRATVRQIASRAEFTDEERPAVKVTVDVDVGESVSQLRPGTTVFAKISCGRKPVGYVWLHDVIDAVRSWFLF